MAYKIVLLERAEIEIKDAYDWYEKQSKGLGDRFLKVLNQYKSAILVNPKLFKCTFKNFREVFLQTFPFLLVYHIDEINKEIIIVSVFHSSRNPKEKYKS